MHLIFWKPIIEAPNLSVSTLSNIGLGDFLGHFHKCMLVKIKRVEKFCIDVWGKSTILKSLIITYNHLFDMVRVLY